MSALVYIESSALFDASRAYRYSLVRRWAPGPMVLWLMLNPSTADETNLDPTLRRCQGFTREWGLGEELAFSRGFGGFVVCNLYGFRSTDPSHLWKPHTVYDEVLDTERIIQPPLDPVGPGNDAAIREAARACDVTIVGWGTHAKPDRARKVAQLLHDEGVKPQALRLGKDGSPGHPLYIPATAPRFPWLSKGLR